MSEFNEMLDVFFNGRPADSYAKKMNGQKAEQFGGSEMCFCVGPQNGQPLCPCAMRSVMIKGGRYVMPERDLGPAPNAR